MDNALHGSIAIIKSAGKVIGKIKSWRFSEQLNRGDVQGLGTIYSSEVPVLKYKGTLAVSQVAISFKNGVIPNAFRRNLSNIASQALGNKSASVEDQLVLDDTGLVIECYKKVADLIDPTTGLIRPKVTPFIICSPCFLEGTSLDISEASLAGMDQNFTVLNPPVYP